MAQENAEGASWRSWIIWGTTSLFFLYQYTILLSFGVVSAEVQSSLAIGATAFGILTALYTSVYGFLQLPGGILLDRVNVRTLLTLCCLVSAIGAAIYGSSSHMIIAALGSILMGAGTTVALIGAVFLIRRWFSPAIFGLVAGLTILVGCEGGALMEQALAVLLQRLGWRGIMMGIAGTGGVLTILLWTIVRDKTKAPENDLPTSEAVQPAGLADVFSVVFKNVQIWLAGAYSGLILGQIIAFGSVWNIPYQMRFYNDLTHSVVINSFIFIGFGLGAPVIGWISDHVRLRIWPTRISAFVVFAAMGLLLWTPPMPDWVVITLLILLGFAAGGSNLAYALGVENGPERASATALGLVATLSFVLGAALQILPGMLLGPASQAGAHEAGKVVHTVAQYGEAFVVFPICSLIAVGVTFLIRETHCRSQVES